MLHTPPRTSLPLSALTALLLAGTTAARSQLTVPATQTTSDAISFNWIAGADGKVR